MSHRYQHQQQPDPYGTYQSYGENNAGQWDWYNAGCYYYYDNQNDATEEYYPSTHTTTVDQGIQQPPPAQNQYQSQPYYYYYYGNTQHQEAPQRGPERQHNYADHNNTPYERESYQRRDTSFRQKKPAQHHHREYSRQQHHYDSEKRYQRQQQPSQDQKYQYFDKNRAKHSHAPPPPPSPPNTKICPYGLVPRSNKECVAQFEIVVEHTFHILSDEINPPAEPPQHETYPWLDLNIVPKEDEYTLIDGVCRPLSFLTAIVLYRKKQV